MMLEFQKRQRAFAQAIRSGEEPNYPLGISPQRMQVYQHNFVANIEEMLSNCFPVLSAILQDSLWRALVEHFYADYPAKTPFFYEIPEAFLTYLLQADDKPVDLPFLMELAHYEWMEIAIDYLESEPPVPMTTDIDVANQVLAVSNVAEVVGYHFPVHRISIDFIPILSNYPATYLCIYRNSEGDVDFIELNALSARLLQQLKMAPCCGKQLSMMLVEETKQQDSSLFFQQNMTILTDLLRLEIIYPLESK